MDWAALEAFLRAVRRSPRAEPAAGRGAIKVDQQRVRWFRGTATHLRRRLAAGSLAQAAFAGLQDSAPRSGLLALHARVRDVDPSAWEHPSLAQIWFRLGADYVVPRADIALFTLGASPRDHEQFAALSELGDIVVRALDGRSRRTRDVETDLPELPNRHLIRVATVSGKILIRWDARTTEVLPAPTLEMDPEDARLELARRFLHWLGPAGPSHFAKWAAVTKDDAERTWAALRAELVPIDYEGRARWLLASDERTLPTAKQPRGVRFLPMGDPFLYMDTPAPPREPKPGPGVTTRLVNSLGGRLLVDGDIVGSWGRVQSDVTIFPWERLSADVDEEAELMSSPLGRPVRLRRLD